MQANARSRQTVLADSIGKQYWQAWGKGGAHTFPLPDTAAQGRTDRNLRHPAGACRQRGKRRPGAIFHYTKGLPASGEAYGGHRAIHFSVNRAVGGDDGVGATEHPVPDMHIEDLAQR